MDFDKCENDAPTEKITLNEQSFATQTDVRFVNFQNVTALTLYFEENYGDDATIA